MFEATFKVLGYLALLLTVVVVGIVIYAKITDDPTSVQYRKDQTEKREDAELQKKRGEAYHNYNGR